MEGSFQIHYRFSPRKRSGNGLEFWKKEVENAIKEALTIEPTIKAAKQLKAALQLFESTASEMKEMFKDGKKLEYLADANLYIEFFWTMNIAWQWLLIGITATKCEHNESNKEKIQTLYFYFQYELGKIEYLSKQILSTEKLTLPN